MAAKSPLTHENQASQMLSNAICSCLLLLIATSPALGQLADQRYQLGRRLIRFETAWQTATPDQRTASVKPVEQAVSSFFGLQLAEAAKRLDQARNRGTLSHRATADMARSQPALCRYRNTNHRSIDVPCNVSGAEALSATDATFGQIGIQFRSRSGFARNTQGNIATQLVLAEWFVARWIIARSSARKHHP